MRVPFPLGLSIGTDIIAHRRLQDSTSHLHRLALRFLHPIELTELAKRHPYWNKPENITTEQKEKFIVHLAGRWAAKEAAKKAWGANLISFRDLRVESLPSGDVQIICQSYRDLTHVSDGKYESRSMDEQVAKLSISHDGDYAVATVLATPLHPNIVADLKARKEEVERKVKGVKDH